MVITYSREELVTIGEALVYKECLGMYADQIGGDQRQNKINYLVWDNVVDSVQSVLLHEIRGQHDKTLTSPVAEFFEKAQKNFLTSISIDPTKVKHLSEVEAELVGRRDEPC